MITEEMQVPEHVKLGKAKAIESVILGSGVRLIKKTKVRYWIERMGARETYCVWHNEKGYRLTAHEFKRRFKVIIKGGDVKLEPEPPEEEKKRIQQSAD